MLPRLKVYNFQKFFYQLICAAFHLKRYRGLIDKSLSKKKGDCIVTTS